MLRADDLCISGKVEIEHGEPRDANRFLRSEMSLLRSVSMKSSVVQGISQSSTEQPEEVVKHVFPH